MNPFARWLSDQFDASPEVKARLIATEANISEGYLSALRSGRRNERPARERAEQIASAFARLRGLDDADAQALVDEALRALVTAEEAVAVPRSEVVGANPDATRPEVGPANWETLFEVWAAHAQ